MHSGLDTLERVTSTFTGEVNVSFSRWKFVQLNEPYHWWLTASSMKDAADLIYRAIEPGRLKPSDEDLRLGTDGFRLVHPSHDLRNVFVLLAGFALENLLKAEFMRQRQPNLEEGKLPRDLRDHDLLRLCEHVNFAPQPSERKMLEIASEASTSWGRYPSGLLHDKGAMAPPSDFDASEFRSEFESFYRKLTEIITRDWEDENQ